MSRFLNSYNDFFDFIRGLPRPSTSLSLVLVLVMTVLPYKVIVASSLGVVLDSSTTNNLSGTILSLEELEKIKDATIINELTQQLHGITDAQKKLEIQKKIDRYKTIKKYLFWHQLTPTTGLWVTEKPPYPFIPHFYSLWDLAPNKGAGITVVIIDNGVAAFDIDGYCSYKKHRDLKMPLKGVNDFLNFESSFELDSLITFIQGIIPNVRVLQSDVVAWIHEYCCYGTNIQLIDFLKSKKLSAFFNQNGTLNENGQSLVELITHNRRGIMPRKKPRFFTPVKLLNSAYDKTILEFLPAASLQHTKRKSLWAAHGTHLFGLINAQCTTQNVKKPQDDCGVIGLAPNAECIMVKACNNEGISDKITLFRALKIAKKFTPDVVNISLKIGDNFAHDDNYFKKIELLIKEFPYTIAASGNIFKSFLGKQLAYPARFPTVTCTVGSFSWDGKTTYQISDFSGFEQGVGPHVVAPGYNIISTGLPTNIDNYLFLSGTSMATALMSGFIALVLSEFKNDFTQEQLLHVLFNSTLRLHTTPEWTNNVVCGVLDMRTALFILHVCKIVKKNMTKVKKSNFEYQFNGIVKKIHDFLFDMPCKFGEKHKIHFNFASSFMDFYDCACSIDSVHAHDFYQLYGLPQKLNDMYEYIAQVVVQS